MAIAKKRVFTILVMAVVALAMIMPAQLQDARADEFNEAKYKKNITVYKDYIPVWVNMGSKINNAKGMTVKSSKPSVIKVNKYAIADRMVVFDTKKTGKATLTIKIKKSSGTKTYKCKVKVVKYSSPAKSVKIAKKSFTKTFKKKNCYPVRKAKNLREKVRVKCKSGWKVTIYHTWMTSGGDFHKKTVKNGGKVKYRKSAEFECLVFSFYDKSRNYTISKTVDVNTNAL